MVGTIALHPEHQSAEISTTTGFPCNSWARGVPAEAICTPRLRLSLAMEVPAIAVIPAMATKLPIPRQSGEKDL